MDTVKIEGNGFPRQTKIFVNGMEITSVVSVWIDFGVDRLPTINLQLLANLDIPEELQGLVSLEQIPNLSGDLGV